MKSLRHFTNSRCLIGLVCAAICLALPQALKAQYVTQTSADGYGASALTGNNWSDGLAPHSGGNYIDNTAGDPTGATGSSYLIRTPLTAGPTVFAGNSLTIANGAQLSIKGSSGESVTIYNLILGANSVVNNQAPNGNGAYVLNGSIVVNGTYAAPSQIAGPTASSTLTVNSSISGSGTLQFSGSGSSILSSANNTLSGGVRISNGGLTVTADGALGSGNLTLLGASSTLTLQGGTLNDYIGNSADLILNSSLAANSINLNFSGIDYLAGLSFDGGSSIDTLAGTTFGAIGSGATITSADFTGTGILEIGTVPEPTTVSFASIGGLCLLVMFWKKKRFVF